MVPPKVCRVVLESLVISSWLIWTPLGLLAQSGVGLVEWRSYAGDLRNYYYSPLDQINASNFNKLEIGWRFTDRERRPEV